jgi:peptide/nickel transport system permease protein
MSMDSVRVVLAADKPPQVRERSDTLWRRLLRDNGTRFGMGVVLAFAFVALAAPWLAPHDPFAVGIPLQAPSGDHLFGTDSLGRDVLSIMIWGTRVTLIFALGAAAISLVAGVLIGGVPAFVGGKVDDFVSRLVELVLMIPMLFLIIAVVAILGNEEVFVMAVVGLTIWPAIAKLMRAQVLSLKDRTFIDAARSAGHTNLFIFRRHIIPNGIGPVIAQVTLQMASAVLIQAGLAFLGLSDPNTASWGQLLNDAQKYIDTAPWLVIVPGLGLFTLLMSLHSLGSGLEKALNPRS